MRGLRPNASTRLAEKIAAGEIVSVPLFIVAGSETEARAQVEQAKADKLAELRAAGDQREVVFAVTLVVTGVLRPGEAADPGRVPTAPAFASREDGPLGRSCRRRRRTHRHEVVEEEAREEPQPPLIETYVCVQIRQCRDDDDPGEIAEGWFSIDGKVRDGHRRERRGTLAVAPCWRARMPVSWRSSYCAKKAPEEEFNRPLSYPSAGLA